MAVDKSILILIVDDQENVHEILREFLRKLGFRHFESALDGVRALEILNSLPEAPGLILSDWNMRPMTGLQLLQAVRVRPQTAKTPFIMITGEAAKDRVTAALDAGVTSFIVKPFSFDAVKKRLSTVLGGEL